MKDVFSTTDFERLVTVYIPHGWKQSATDWLDKRGFDLRMMDLNIRQNFTEAWIWV